MNEIELCGMETCTQCYGCITICPKSCISMGEAKDGFVIPIIDRDHCIECGACMRTCHRIEPSFTFQKPIKAYACWTTDVIDRKRSSSGGAFSVIAKKILHEGGLVYGATMKEDLKVSHIRIERLEDVQLLQGSKYIQSYQGDIYKDVKMQLQKGHKVLFSGTPCQVAGLQTFLHKQYENLYTCDVVCHGVPSQDFFDIYLDRIGLKGKCENFNFRFTEGWGFRLSKQKTALRGSSQRKVALSPSKSYFLRAFNKGLMFGEACYSCPYARPERVSDITLGDYWGIGTMAPFNHSTKRGISLLLANNQKAVEFISGCESISLEERPIEEAIKGNHNLSKTSARPKGRDTYYEDSIRLPVKQLKVRYGLQESFRDYLRLAKQSLIVILP